MTITKSNFYYAESVEPAHIKFDGYTLELEDSIECLLQVLTEEQRAAYRALMEIRRDERAARTRR